MANLGIMVRLWWVVAGKRCVWLVGVGGGNVCKTSLKTQKNATIDRNGLQWLFLQRSKTSQ